MYNEDKIRNDKDYYKSVLINHFLLYYIPLSRIAYNNWKIEILDFNIGFAIMISISLVIVLRARYKKLYRKK